MTPEGLVALENATGLRGELFSEPKDVLLGFKESEETNNCKYFREE